MCVVSKMENTVKKLICAVKNVRYIKCALYQMYAKLRLNLQRWIADLSVNSGNVRCTGVCVISRGRYIEVLLYLISSLYYLLNVFVQTTQLPENVCRGSGLMYHCPEVKILMPSTAPIDIKTQRLPVRHFAVVMTSYPALEELLTDHLQDMCLIYTKTDYIF